MYSINLSHSENDLYIVKGHRICSVEQMGTLWRKLGTYSHAIKQSEDKLKLLGKSKYSFGVAKIYKIKSYSTLKLFFTVGFSHQEMGVMRWCQVR